MTRVELEPGWEEKILAAWDVFADERLGPEIVADAKRFAPIGTGYVIVDPAKHPRTPPERQPGELRESIGHHLDGHTLIIEARAPYAAYVELGVRPHLIRAHGPWSLWGPVPNRYFGGTVHHPGSRPQPFLRSALYRVRRE